MPARTRAGSMKRYIVWVSSRRNEIDRFDDVAHEPRGVPVGCGRLRLAVLVRATDHQTNFAGRRRREPGLPLPEAVFARINSELRQLPGLAAVDRDVNASHAA